MSIEQELLSATGVKKGKFKDRQKLLAAVVKVVEKLPDDEYRGLSDEAVDWYEKAIESMNGSHEVPEFDTPEEGDPEDAPDGDPEEGEEPEETEEPDEPQDEDAEPEEAEEPDAAKEAPTAEEPEAEEAEEPEPEEKPKKAPKKAPKAKKAKAEPAPTRYDNLSGKKNRYGLYEGTILDDVVQTLEKGATMAEVKERHGDTKYNLVKRLEKEGHHFEKDGTKFTLFHKDDWAAKGKGKKK